MSRRGCRRPGQAAGARDDWGGIERVEREWDLGARGRRGGGANERRHRLCGSAGPSAERGGAGAKHRREAAWEALRQPGSPREPAQAPRGACAGSRGAPQAFARPLIDRGEGRDYDSG